MFRRSGRRFADKNMRQSMNLERIPIPQERNTFWLVSTSSMKTRLVIFFLFAFALSAAPPASAQPYPSRAVTIVAPYGAGGTTDILARIVAEGMRGPLGQSVVIENVAGASGTIGVGRVA